jgi:transglutaminase-like putative cysteine protease
MLIRCGYDIAFAAEAPTPMLALLSIRPERARDLRSPHRIALTPDVPAFDFTDAFGNVCTRFTVPPGGLELSCEFVIEDSGDPDPAAPRAVQHPVDQLPDHVLPFLLPSRYCETDLLLDTAWGLFSDTRPGWERVQAVCDFVHSHIAFGYPDADSHRTALRAFHDRRGVCRDFAHLAVALCRCLNIPARYCTGYLGDIGVPAVDDPMDFSAWFEVYLGDRWHTFDARHNRPRIGRVLMAVGRDAADTALTTAFGHAPLRRFIVRTDEIVGVSAWG